ncbi:MAG: histone deacetylase family protein [Solirubrobacteraceae bacterium]
MLQPSASAAVVTSDRFIDHVTPPGHPERPERAETMQVIALEWREQGGRLLAPRAATRDELARVHSEAHLDRIAATAGRAVALDPDTCTSPDSHEVACLAAGAALTATDWAMASDGPGRVGYSLARPPGHHAERDKAMGFCLYNNVAVAAAHARALGAERVAIVDYDVHHGNGTQAIFYDDPHVLYVSTHQYPYYPGTGAASETGRGRGAGFTVNVPLEAGATDADYALVFGTAIVPILDRFDPQVLFISAGFDADARDPLAGMRMSTGGFAHLTEVLRTVAAAHGGGRIVLVAEGGYHLQALAEGLRATLDVVGLVTEPGARVAGAQTGAAATRRADAALEVVRAAQRPFWGEL